MTRGAASADLRVLAWPGLGFKAKNPYTWLLYTHLRELGVAVRDYSAARAVRGGYDIMHVHWPEKALNAGPVVGRVAGGAAALSMLAVARRHGAKVVWTAHNARPHESRHPGLEERYWGAVVRRIDAVIYPSAASQRAIEARYPDLTRRPHAVVALGHYRGAYDDSVTREQARASFGIANGVRVISFVGLVRPYKNVPHLVRTVRALPPEAGEVVLLVGGEPLTPALADEIRHAAGGDPRVQLFLRHVPEHEVQRYLRAADLAVLPFREITNSSSALLALSFDRPVVVPCQGALGDLQRLAGPDWVSTYEGDLTTDIVVRALDWAARPPDAAPDLSAIDWPELARQTLDLYLAVAR